MQVRNPASKVVFMALALPWAAAPLFSQDPVFIARRIPAERVTVVQGEGHFPVACLLKNGQLAVVLRGGAPHVGIKGRLDLVTSDDDGHTWSAPRTVVDSPFDDRNPAFGQLSDGSLVLAYVEETSGFDKSGLREKDAKTDGVFVVRSSDHGATWSSPYKFTVDGATGFSPFGKIIQLPDGTALMAVYLDTQSGSDESRLYRSRDNGKSWGDPSLIAAHYNETALASLPDGRLLAALRSTRGRVAVAASKDLGRTWSDPVELTRDQEHPGDLIVLGNGTVVLTYGERNRPQGVRALLSHDGGNSWDHEHLMILADDAPNWDAGYPSSVVLKDGSIFTVYYQNDVAYDPTLPDGALEKSVQGAQARGVIWRVPGQ